MVGTVLLELTLEDGSKKELPVRLSKEPITRFSFPTEQVVSEIAWSPNNLFPIYLPMSSIWADVRRKHLDWPEGTAHASEQQRIMLVAPSTFLKLGKWQSRFSASTSLALDGLGAPNLGLDTVLGSLYSGLWGELVLGLDAHYLYSLATNPDIHRLETGLTLTYALQKWMAKKGYLGFWNLSLGVFGVLAGNDDLADGLGLGIRVNNQWMLTRSWSVHFSYRHDFYQKSNGWDVRTTYRLGSFLLGAGFLQGNANLLGNLTILAEEIDWDLMPFVDLGWIF